MLRTTAGGGLAALLAAVLVTGAPPASAERAPTEVLQSVQNYLNLLRTVEARFIQVSSTGERATGTLYLERPGRLRVQYDPPSPVLIVANRGLLVYFDRKLEQVTHVPLDSTPAGILLAPSIRLDGGTISVTAIEERENAVRVTLERKDNPGEGSLTLEFSDLPLQLTQWTVNDAQGVATTVVLQSARFEHKLDQKLFEFEDPRFFRERL